MEESEIKPDVQEKVESLADKAIEENINNAQVKNAESKSKNESIFQYPFKNRIILSIRFNIF